MRTYGSQSGSQQFLEKRKYVSAVGTRTSDCPAGRLSAIPKTAKSFGELAVKTLRTGDADLRLYITTVQDG